MGDAAIFQEAFGAALAGGGGAADAALARALRIHRNTAAKAAQDALADNFPVLRAMVGDDAFAAAAASFADAYPPVDPRLCVYGAGFDYFLLGYAPFAELPYLADVAAVEQLVVTALFAADAVPLDATSLVIDLERPLSLHPAIGVASFVSPAGSLWLAHQPGAEDDAFDRFEFRPETVLVSRPHNAVIVTVVPFEAAAFIAACAAGHPLQVAAAACGEAVSDVFTALVSAGCFV